MEFYRADANRFLTSANRAELGQFLTPAPVARFMAGLSSVTSRDVSLLDPGAGVGSLTAALVAELLSRNRRPRSIRATFCEVDQQLVRYLRQTINDCQQACEERGVEFHGELLDQDFIETATNWLAPQPLFSASVPTFNSVILNPPYRKIQSSSDARLALRTVGIETSNLYTAFLWLVLKLLSPQGEMIAITPRSFCNGPYFRPFREALLSEATITQVHVFESRRTAFREDDVLQENIIFRAVRSKQHTDPIVISTSQGPDDPDISQRRIEPDDLVAKDDPNQVIHLVPDELQGQLARRIRSFSSALGDLDIQVSTGRVVDFRAKEYLIYGEARPNGKTAPLIYPTHFDNGLIAWPKAGKKPNYLSIADETQPLLVPAGVYVLVKRFSAKEEKRRVSAAIILPEQSPKIGFALENHLNFYHDKGQGLTLDLARGLAAYLNSTLVDSFFRQFSGHTQVNASDLRTLPYPDRHTLERVGRRIGDQRPTQELIDQLIAKELSHVAQDKEDPLNARKRIDEALAILKVLGLPRAQQNDRSALTLLALAEVTPKTPWESAGSPLMGITPIMDFAKNHYGTTYAPNTRETFRRQTMHQFVEAGIALYNPDAPSRPVNSPKAVYQIAPLLLDVLRSYGTQQWDELLRDWLSSVETLKVRYAREREMAKIPLKLPTGEQIELSPGGQNVLVEQIIHEFCPRFTPGGQPIYVGDTEEKYAYFNKPALQVLGVTVDAHGKMPDVVIHHTEKNWLVLIEAVTSHGPVDGKRRDELRRLFAASTAPLVFVTAFMDRGAMVRFLGDISWETEVWVADAPSHMIHFNGERFLGPYEG
ncbi:MAG TPA: BsuBI/PstI family type II restriction endonuclease [Pirellulales bacterium]|nr:BsuBI/PstI family type II restriction endonuclease [Pirellulales bacterium]